MQSYRSKKRLSSSGAKQDRLKWRRDADRKGRKCIGSGRATCRSRARSEAISGKPHRSKSPSEGAEIRSGSGAVAASNVLAPSQTRKKKFMRFIRDEKIIRPKRRQFPQEKQKTLWTKGPRNGQLPHRVLNLSRRSTAIQKRRVKIRQKGFKSSNLRFLFLNCHGNREVVRRKSSFPVLRKETSVLEESKNDKIASLQEKKLREVFHLRFLSPRGQI